MHWNIARSLPESGILHQLACKHKVRCCASCVSPNTSYRTAARAVALHPAERSTPPTPLHLSSHVKIKEKKNQGQLHI